MIMDINAIVCFIFIVVVVVIGVSMRRNPWNKRRQGCKQFIVIIVVGFVIIFGDTRSCLQCSSGPSISYVVVIGLSMGRNPLNKQRKGYT